MTSHETLQADLLQYTERIDVSQVLALYAIAEAIKDLAAAIRENNNALP